MLPMDYVAYGHKSSSLIIKCRLILVKIVMLIDSMKCNNKNAMQIENGNVVKIFLDETLSESNWRI